MTFDPTTNRIQTMHLTAEERATLEAWPHGWEFFFISRWESREDPSWNKHTVYRGKPAPVVTSVWFNVYPDFARKSYSRHDVDIAAGSDRIDVLRIDTCNGVSTAHLEGLE